MRKIKETKMLEGKISKEDLIRANVDRDRVVRAIQMYVESSDTDGEKQIKVFYTNGIRTRSMVVSQRDVYHFTEGLSNVEILGLVNPEDIIDVRDEMHLEGLHPVWGWKKSGFGLDGSNEITLGYMEIPFKYFRF